MAFLFFLMLLKQAISAASPYASLACVNASKYDATCDAYFTYYNIASTATCSTAVTISGTSYTVKQIFEYSIFPDCCNGGQKGCVSPTVTTNYSFNCKFASAYNASSCDSSMPYYGLNDPAKTCEANITIPGIGQTTVKNSLSMLQQNNKCCSDGKTRCSADYSFNCQNSDAYSSSCDYYVAIYKLDTNRTCSSTVSLSGASMTVKQWLSSLQSQYGCCSDGKTKCYVDYAPICMNPATWLPNKNLSSGSTCYSFADTMGSTAFASCSSTYQGYSVSFWLSYLASSNSCCSDGVSRCMVSSSSTRSVSPSRSASNSPPPPSVTPSTSKSPPPPSVTPSTSETPPPRSATPSTSESPSVTPSTSESPSATPSTSESKSSTASVSQSPSNSASVVSSSQSPSVSLSASVSQSPATPSSTASISVSSSTSVSASKSAHEHSHVACSSYKNCSICMDDDNDCIYCPSGCKSISGSGSAPLGTNLSDAVDWYNDQCNTDCPTDPIHKPASSINAAIDYCFFSQDANFTAECGASGSLSAAFDVSVSGYTALATGLFTLALLSFRR
eukprot:g30267.t1